jgi:uncharacterized protein
MTKSRTSSRAWVPFIWTGVVVLALVIYLGVGVRAANTWAHPRRNTYFSATPASFNLPYRDVRLSSRDAGIEISGWWIPRAGSGKAIVMVHGRGENRTTEFYDHFLDLGAALNTFQGRGFNVLMIDLRAHGLSGGVDSTWGIGERHDVEGAVDWIKGQGFQPAGIGALGASLGATSCVYATADDPDISALVTDGAGVDEYASLERGWKRSSGTPQFFFPAAVRSPHTAAGRRYEADSPSAGTAHLRSSGIARRQRPAPPDQSCFAGRRAMGGARRDPYGCLHQGPTAVSR